MIIYAIAAALVLILPMVGLLPPMVRGNQNANSFVAITMRDPKDQRQPHRAIFAQEVVEWWVKWFIGAILGIVPAYYVAATDFWFVTPAFMVLCGAFWRVLPGQQKQLELLGHSAELYVANADIAYKKAEAGVIQRGYGGIFAKMTIEQIVEAMERRRWLAKILVNLLWLRIKKEPV